MLKGEIQAWILKRVHKYQGTPEMSVAEHEDAADEEAHDRINQLQSMGTHNSYKQAIPDVEMAIIKERNPNAAITLDYSHRPVAEQLDKGARQLELDPSDDPQGGLFSTPVINHPEVGILGIGKVVKRPVFDEVGQVRPADIVYLSFSFDHRVVDGAVGAAFGNAVLKQLQGPALMLLPAQL